METLILNSLEISNFREFRHLKIEHLGRVNLLWVKTTLENLVCWKHCKCTPVRVYAQTIISEIIEIGNDIKPPSKEITCVLVPANGLNRSTVIELWDRIASTGLQGEVINALCFIAPGVEGLELVILPHLMGNVIW